MRRLPTVTIALAASVLAASCAASAGPPVEPPPPVELSSAHATHAADPSDAGVAPAGTVGVLVMAHGGTREWNASVRQAVAPLASEVPTSIAWGMADPGSLSESLQELEERGVRRVAVVRMFLSGASFLDQTRYFLGLSETPPEHFVLMSHGAHGGGMPARGMHAGGAHTGTPEPLRHGLAVETHDFGILGSSEATEVMVDRARALSVSARDESVLLLAHGMGDEAENQAVLDAMDVIAARVSTLGFPEVHSATLREDWPEARAASEADVRAWVEEQDAAGRRVLVVPMRLSGFGPYADVLAGLPYVAGDGLVPHEAIGAWVRSTADRVSCGAGWGPVADTCATVAVEQQAGPVGR